VIRDSRGWFTEGSAQKRVARRDRRCVECRRALPDGRSPYCSRRCQWGFRGRYFWDAARTFVIHRDRFTCQVCRRRYRVHLLEVDHIVEVARGGPSLDYLNLQTVCRSCHRAKTVRFLRGRRRGASDPTATDGPAPPGWGADWFPS
jgi:5-methylcytosine-specific restriction endonuclease McrA